jgi:hypothetical protein
LASDGKWYSPEQWTGPPNTGPPAGTGPGTATAAPGPVPAYTSRAPSYPTQPAAGVPYGAGTYPPQGYVQQGHPPQGYGQTPGPHGEYPSHGARPSRKTNGLAIASLVCSIAGFLVIPLVLGVVFGFVARSQIMKSNGTQGGRGLALAGIIVGFGWAALIVLGAIGNATSNTPTGLVGLFGALG